MSTVKTTKTRVLLKTGTTSDWNAAAFNSHFVPLLGEVCIYMDRIPVYKENGELDYYIPGIKIGDGLSQIDELPFVGDEYISTEEIDSLF